MCTDAVLWGPSQVLTSRRDVVQWLRRGWCAGRLFLPKGSRGSSRGLGATGGVAVLRSASRGAGGRGGRENSRGDRGAPRGRSASGGAGAARSASRGGGGDAGRGVRGGRSRSQRAPVASRGKCRDLDPDGNIIKVPTRRYTYDTDVYYDTLDKVSAGTSPRCRHTLAVELAPWASLSSRSASARCIAAARVISSRRRSSVLGTTSRKRF